MRQRLKLLLSMLTVVMAIAALWQVQKIADAIRREEEEKVRIWAAAIGQRSRMVEETQRFFAEATIDEQRKMSLYTEVLQSFDKPDMNTDLDISLGYVRYIVDSSKTPIIITTAKDTIITVPQDLAGQKLTGKLLEEYSKNPPFRYEIWGMPMTLYYKESENYTRLRTVLEELTKSFLDDITSSSLKVPALIVDSVEREIIAYGNIDTLRINDIQQTLYKTATVDERRELLGEHLRENPIEISLPEGMAAKIYYEKTPLLRALRWMPIFYIFIGLVLISISYTLFRTAQTAEQNRIWVGLAKETAHQLGTPLSSLIAWTQYLRGKELTAEYATEIDKDLNRLETITHRFSKIGSQPELQDEDVQAATRAAVEYLKSRSPRKVKFTETFAGEESYMAPLNGYLFQWVIENICKNAIDAMDGEGVISIVASQDARKIYIDISDTGKGMTGSVQRKIFNSGFTTKTRGWGLGLPLAKRIINQYHRGRLYLKYSVPGQGSTFRIELKKK